MNAVKLTLLFLLTITLSYSRFKKECYNQLECNPSTEELNPNVSYVCHNNECKCGPNYRHKESDNTCHEFICESDEECTQFESNRKCSKEGKCVCDEGYVEDPDNGYACSHYIIRPKLESKCRTTKDCPIGRNFRCVQNKCLCEPNYSLNEFGFCKRDESCKTNQDCYRYYDQNRICLNVTIKDHYFGKCICGSGFVENNPEQKVCTNKSNSSNEVLDMYCESDSQCDEALPRYNREYNFVCFDQKCKCKANYHYSDGSCHLFTCKDNDECQDYDSNRICSENECICREGTTEDNSNGRKCRERHNTSDTSNDIFNRYCTDDYDCELDSSTHKWFRYICYDNRCKCEPNYYYSKGLCHHFYCEDHNECQIYDSNRICSEGNCLCKWGTTQQYSKGRKCIPNDNITDLFSDGFKILFDGWAQIN